MNAGDLQAGDIVKVPFPMHDGISKIHYGIVARVERDFSGIVITVIYGSSKKVSVSGHLDHEVIVHTPKDLALAGLTKPTRFDFRIQARFPATLCVPVGKLDLENPRIANSVRSAMVAAIRD